ncbi:MAG TPA: LD-carboxypeptidase [Bacteroidales bacterium]|nr:LD-carboxypeptidase [Bacteroidales bacterium]
MITPSYLKRGDLIGIVAPARRTSPEEMAPALEMIEARGFRIRLGEHLYAADRQFAGTDAQRAADVQRMIGDPEVRAILCARGGYGSVRLVDRIDWQALARDPKWIIGYSDVTVFHSHIHRHLGMETLHATMPLNFAQPGAEESLSSLWKALEGQLQGYTAPAHPLNRAGMAEGQLVGGNLSVLYSLMGSPSDLDVAGKILFIEDLDEYLYHIDRMMMNLKRNAWPDRIVGLMVGGMTQMNDNTVPFGRTAEEIIREAMEGFDIPLAFGFPAGHLADNRALMLGRRVQLSVNGIVEVRFE